MHGGGAVGRALVESSAAKIFFTGSVEVGAAWARMRPAHQGLVLELGGKDPMVVCADANLPNAIAGCLWGGFANAGQTCSGIERVYVVEEVAERFVAGVVEGAGNCARATRSTAPPRSARWSRASSSSSSRSWWTTPWPPARR